MTALVAALLAVLGAPALAHGYKQGELYLAHPHGHVVVGADGRPALGVHFAAVRNGEGHIERLLSARYRNAPLRLQRRGDDGRYADVEALSFASGERLVLRNGGPMRLLIEPLDVVPALGDRLRVILEFEKAGAIEVEVRIEQPKESADAKP
jgi:hypothetical protein